MASNDEQEKPRFRDITLTIGELIEAVKILNGAIEVYAPSKNDVDDDFILETEVTLFYRENDEVSICGSPLPKGWYCFESACPEEGCHELYIPSESKDESGGC